MLILKIMEVVEIEKGVTWQSSKYAHNRLKVY